MNSDWKFRRLHPGGRWAPSPVALGAAVAAALLLQGCGLSSITSGLSGGVFGGKPAATGEAKPVTQEQMLAAAKSEGPASGADPGIGCPRFQIWQRDRNLTIYEAGRVGDGLAIMHQGEITQTARECQSEGGRVTVKYGFSGRVLMGPKGRAGIVSLPVNVFVTDSKRERLFSEPMKVEVAISPEKPIGYFSTVKTVTITVPEGGRAADFEVHVGFERGPGAS